MTLALKDRLLMVRELFVKSCGQSEMFKMPL